MVLRVIYAAGRPTRVALASLKKFRSANAVCDNNEVDSAWLYLYSSEPIPFEILITADYSRSFGVVQARIYNWFDFLWANGQVISYNRASIFLKEREFFYDE